MNKIKAKKAAAKNSAGGTTYNVYGMTCNGCSSRLQALFLKNDQIENAVVDHEKNTATIYGSAPEETIKSIVEAAGFSMVP